MRIHYRKRCSLLVGESRQSNTEERERKDGQGGEQRRGSSKQRAPFLTHLTSCCSEAEIRLCRSLPNGIDHYKNTSFGLGKQHCRRTVKYHDSVVEVNIAREERIIIILGGGSEIDGHFQSVGAETKDSRPQLPITRVGVCLIVMTEALICVTDGVSRSSC